MPSASPSTSQAANPAPFTPVKALKSVHDANRDLEKSLAQLDISSNQLPKIGEMKDSGPDLTALRKQLNKHKAAQEKQVISIQDKRFKSLQKKLLGEREKYVESMAKDEIARQVSEEVERQIREFLPVSLEDQVRDARQYLEKLKMSLKNSQARVENGSIQVGDWQEGLKEVVRYDGKISTLYPTDLATLYGYEKDEMKDLLEFYGMNEDTSEDWRKRDMNRFMQFIGVRGEVDLK